MTLSTSPSQLQFQALQGNLLHRITNRIRQSLQLQEILQSTVTEIRAFLETDRVMVYRFHPDEHGEVIAEAIDNHRLPSLMGLHFPADDIPPQARQLFLQARQRKIVDLSTLQTAWSVPRSIEESNVTEGIHYRPVDPCHVEYLTAMGVQSSVVVPILQADQLWGLLVAHHSQPRTVSEAELHLLQLIVDQVAIAITQSTLLSQVQAQADRESVANQVATLLHCESDAPFAAALEAIVAAMAGSGGRLLLLDAAEQPNGFYCCGTQPPVATKQFLEQHSLWKTALASPELAIADLYHDDRCQSLQDIFQTTFIRSLLIIPLRQGSRMVGWLTLFRNEIETETLWAGKINPDTRQTVPRRSFERWRQHRVGQAQDWTETDLNLVKAVKNHFVLAIGQHQLQRQVQALNASLQQQVQHQTRDLANIQFALDQSSIVAITDREGIICYVNHKFCEISGYCGADLMGQSHRLINSGYHPPEFFSRMWQTIVSGEVWRGEIKNRAKDGTEYWVDTTIVPLLNEHGHPQQYVAIQTDITDRKQAEAAVNYQSSLLQNVIDSSTDWIFAKDLNFRYLLVNQTYATAIARAPEDIVGRDDLELGFPLEQVFGNPAKEIVGFRVDDQNAIAGEVVLNLAEPATVADGSIVWLETKKLPLRDHVGHIWGVLGVCRDVTERKQAEEALRQKAQQEQLLNQLATQIRSSLDIDQILATAVQSIRDLLEVDRSTFVWYRPHANPPIWECVHEAKLPELSTVVGLYPSDTIGSTAARLQNLEIIQDDDVTVIPDPQWRQLLLSVGYKSSLSIPIQTSMGEIGVISCSHERSPHPWQEWQVEWLTAVANQLAIALNQADLYKRSRLAAATAQAQAEQLEHALHELRQTQAQLVQTEKMSSLGQLVAGVAHEINNPVNFIYGNLTPAGQYAHDLLDLLKLYQQYYPNPAPAIQAQVEEIDLDFLTEDLPKLLTSMKLGADRIQEIVLALRNFSRMDEAEVKAVNLHDGIDSTLMILQNRLKETAGHSPIKVIKDYKDLPLVECYAGQLNQVFMNILSNAIDALEERREVRGERQEAETTPHSPLPTPHPPTITIYTEAIGDRVFIRIADNGPGMSEQVQRRLFEPFFTTKMVGKGTGLGLSISYQVVVDKHGGRLSCHSAPGKGTQFVIELPLKLTHKST